MRIGEGDLKSTPAGPAGGGENALICTAYRGPVMSKRKASSPPPLDELQHEFLNAAQRYDWNEVKDMLEASDEQRRLLINAQPAERWTALHQAAGCGDIEMVKYLVENGAELHLLTKDGMKPSEVAKGEAIRSFLENEEKRQRVERATNY